MTENPSIQFENKDDAKERKIEELLALATELRESQEVFAFPGVEAETHAKLKASDEEFPGYVTPIDELIERFKNEGMKVSLGLIPRASLFLYCQRRVMILEMTVFIPDICKLTR